MAEHVTAWQCIGCGRIEAPQTCIGVCRDRKIEMVYAEEHAQALEELRLAREQAASYAALLRRLARITPRTGQWERSYRALQREASELLDEKEGAAAPERSER